jgi:hypothetical protein
MKALEDQAIELTAEIVAFHDELLRYGQHPFTPVHSWVVTQMILRTLTAATRQEKD